MLRPFRPAFERLENREVFSAGPLAGNTAGYLPQTFGEDHLKAAPEVRSSVVTNGDWGRVSARECWPSSLDPSDHLRVDNASNHDAVFAALAINGCMNGGDSNPGVFSGHLPPSRDEVFARLGDGALTVTDHSGVGITHDSDFEKWAAVEANAMVIMPDPGVILDRDLLDAPQTKHDTVKNSLNNLTAPASGPRSVFFGKYIGMDGRAAAADLTSNDLF